LLKDDTSYVLRIFKLIFKCPELFEGHKI